jgi:phosphoribosylanthranilate isomerase
MIKVKVCGLNDPSNVKAISECGPDFIGFIFYPGSKRFAGEYPDKKLFMNVPEGINKTGVFVNEESSRILELAQYAELKVIQLHGNESVNYCKSLKASGLLIIKSFRVGKYFDPRITDHYTDACDFFLFDTESEYHGGSGKKFNWSILGNYGFKKPFFLSGGIGPEDTGIVATIINQQFYAVDVNSRFEILPGIKDAARVKNFINEIKRSYI